MARKTGKSEPRKRRPALASFDPQGWVRRTYDRAIQLVDYSCDRARPIWGASIKLAARALTNWVKFPNEEHDLFAAHISGVSRQVTEEDPRVVLLRLAALDWSKVTTTTVLDLKFNRYALELLRSASDSKDWIDTTKVQFGTLFAMLAVANELPHSIGISPIYFELNRNSIQAWTMQSSEVYNRNGTCEVTGKDGPTVLCVGKDGGTLEVSTRARKELKLRKFEKVSTIGVKQFGYPDLSTCPCCILRRSHRTEGEPAFPLPSRFYDKGTDWNLIGNPVDASQTVLSSCYVMVIPTNNGVKREYRRLCPSCLRVAMDDPTSYHAYISELKANRGNPTTPAMIGEWRLEFQEEATSDLEYVTGKEAAEVIATDLSREEIPKPVALTKQRILGICSKIQKREPGMLDGFVEYSTSQKSDRIYAKLRKDVSVDNLIEAMQAFGYLDENGEELEL